MTYRDERLAEMRAENAGLRAFSEKDYDPRDLNKAYDVWTHPDLLMNKLWRYPCGVEVAFHWDQWMVATIECSHDTFRGSSYGFGNPMGTSLGGAFRAFLTANHGVCLNPKHAEPNEVHGYDACVVCQKMRMLW